MAIYCPGMIVDKPLLMDSSIRDGIPRFVGDVAMQRIVPPSGGALFGQCSSKVLRRSLSFYAQSDGMRAGGLETYRAIPCRRLAVETFAEVSLGALGDWSATPT